MAYTRKVLQDAVACFAVTLDSKLSPSWGISFVFGKGAKGGKGGDK